MKIDESSTVALREVLERDGVIAPKETSWQTGQRVSIGYYVVLFISTTLGVVAGRLLYQLL